jgi:hypothetical protein
MTIDRPTTLPPRWAESLLRILLPSKDRDSISGDLLEEYRESIVPALGHKADRWYLGQVFGLLWPASWFWGVAVGAILVGRNLLDALAPVTYTRGVFHPRATIMSEVLIATYFLAAFWSTWRLGHLRSGVVVAFVTALSGAALTSAGAVVMLAFWHDPQTLQAIHNSGGLDELLWGVPLELIPIGLICGTAGALAGKLTVILYGLSSAKTNSA